MSGCPDERASVLATEGRGLYVASRTTHGAMWRALRKDGFRINSSWIDECEVGETDDFSDLWDRIFSEVRQSKALVLYAVAGDFPLKGAFVEVGMAMACGLPIVVSAPGVEIENRTMRPIGSWMLHKSVIRVDDLRTAMYAAGRPSMVPHSSLVAQGTATHQATPPLDTTQASAVATRDNARTTNTNDGEGQ